MDYIIKLIKKKRYALLEKWTWRLAWRDARFNLKRLFLFISSIIIGVAGMVAINSFNQNLQGDINDQAKQLLGADLEVESDEKPLDTATYNYIKSLSQDSAKEASFASMVYFPKNGGSRLIGVKALEGNYPFYGDIELSEDSDMSLYDQGKAVLIDESLALQFDIAVGDSLKLGKGRYLISGIVIQFPGNTNITTAWAPTVYLPYSRLEETNLIQYGSRVEYKNYFKISDEGIEKAKERLDKLDDTEDVDYETAESERDDMGEEFRNLYRYFKLLSFVALILGCIGVSSSIYVYLREKRNAAAVLRCLGASGWQILYVFFIQVFTLGIVGSLLGVAFGVGIQYFLPWVVSDFLPVDVTLQLSWFSIGEGLLVGILITVLFSALPLSDIRFIPPLELLRGSEIKQNIVSKFRIFIISMIVVFPYLFAVYQTDDWGKGSAFYFGLLLTFVLLYFISKLLMKSIKKLMPRSSSFIWRQGFSNLFRPNNQTTVLVIVIGLGAFLISTLTLIQDSLLEQVEFVGADERSNTVLFDIQPYQKEGVENLLAEYEIPIQQNVPIVTMRIDSFRSKSVEEWQNDTSADISEWAITHEYRVTYRDSLIDSEKLLEGKLDYPKSEDSIFISIENRMADRLNLELKDPITFNVQGLPITTYIGSIREVDWQRVQTNFMVVFPEGVLEEAPQFHVMISRIEDKNKAAAFQRDLVLEFPNVSLIDLNLILNTLDDIFNKIAFVIRFMALFSILTGMLVLSAAVINSKYARLKENVLLRTIGALKKQISGMTIVEYGYLGLFAGLAGSLLAVIASWVLTTYFFETIFLPNFFILFAIWIGISLLTILIGWYNTRSILNKSPLEVLRKEA